MFEIQNEWNLQIEPPNCLQYWDLCHNSYYYNGIDKSIDLFTC